MRGVEDIGFQRLRQGASTDGLGVVAGATVVAVGAIALLSRRSRAEAELDERLVRQEDAAFNRAKSFFLHGIESPEERAVFQKALDEAWQSVLGPRRSRRKTSPLLVHRFEVSLGTIVDVPERREAFFRFLGENPGLSPEAMFMAIMQIGMPSRFADVGESVARMNELVSILRGVREPSDRRRLSAAFLRSQKFLQKIPKEIVEDTVLVEKHLWGAEEGPYAPSFHLATDNVGSLIAMGISPNVLFAPIDLKKHPEYIEGGYDPDLAREDYIRQACIPEVKHDIERGAEEYESDDQWVTDTYTLSTRMSRSPRLTEWLVSTCKDTPRRKALYQLRTLPSPYGAPEKGRYVKKFGETLFDRNRRAVEEVDVKSPSSSPESVFLNALHRRVKEEQDKVFSQPAEVIAVPPPGWHGDRLEELRDQGVELNFLDTAQKIVREGLELNNCAQDPEKYVPSVQKGQSYLIGIKLPDGRRSLLELKVKSHPEDMADPHIPSVYVAQNRELSNVSVKDARKQIGEEIARALSDARRL